MCPKSSERNRANIASPPNHPPTPKTAKMAATTPSLNPAWRFDQNIISANTATNSPTNTKKPPRLFATTTPAAVKTANTKSNTCGSPPDRFDTERRATFRRRNTHQNPNVTGHIKFRYCAPLER